MDLLNKEAIPAAKLAEAEPNILAAEPNTETIDDKPKYTTWEWMNELAKRYFRTLDTRGNEKRAVQAAEPVEDMFS